MEVSEKKSSDSHTRFFHEWLDPIMTMNLNGVQHDIILWIARNSFGRNGQKTTDYSWGRIARDTNRSRANVARESKILLKKQFLYLQNERIGIQKKSPLWIKAGSATPHGCDTARVRHRYKKGATPHGSHPYKKEKRNVASPEALRLANLLASKIKANNPNSLDRDSKPVKWAEDIDKLFRLDKQPWPLIEKVLLWSQNDSFWKQNIRSGSKLRKQWSQLTGKMNQEQSRLQHHPSDYV